MYDDQNRSRRFSYFGAGFFSTGFSAGFFSAKSGITEGFTVTGVSGFFCSTEFSLSIPLFCSVNDSSFSIWIPFSSATDLANSSLGNF